MADTSPPAALLPAALLPLPLPGAPRAVRAVVVRSPAGVVGRSRGMRDGGAAAAAAGAAAVGGRCSGRCGGGGGAGMATVAAAAESGAGASVCHIPLSAFATHVAGGSAALCAASDVSNTDSMASPAAGAVTVATAAAAPASVCAAGLRHAPQCTRWLHSAAAPWNWAPQEPQATGAALAIASGDGMLPSVAVERLTASSPPAITSGIGGTTTASTPMARMAASISSS